MLLLDVLECPTNPADGLLQGRSGIAFPRSCAERDERPSTIRRLRISLRMAVPSCHRTSSE